jgi:hypothetical protein
MAFQTTEKAIRSSSTRTVSAGYCELQFLLRHHSPIAYTRGVYGWNFDVYKIDGLTICTGYRRMIGRRANNAAEYNERARAIWENWKRDYDDRVAEVEKLLHEFVAQA